MDFVYDVPAKVKKLRLLTVVDACWRNVLVLDAMFSYSGENVVVTLNRIFSQTG